MLKRRPCTILEEEDEPSSGPTCSKISNLLLCVKTFKYSEKKFQQDINLVQQVYTLILRYLSLIQSHKESLLKRIRENCSCQASRLACAVSVVSGYMYLSQLVPVFGLLIPNLWSTRTYQSQLVPVVG